MWKLSTVLLGVALIATSFSFAQQQSQGDDDGTSLPALMEQREKTLQILVDLARSSFEEGNTSLESLAAAEKVLLDARLDAARTIRERIEIRESQLSIAKQREDFVAKLAENAMASREELILATAERPHCSNRTLEGTSETMKSPVNRQQGDCGS